MPKKSDNRRAYRYVYNLLQRRFKHQLKIPSLNSGVIE
nr:MAG TPA: hypothetical protein [Caudoviricetes sp.]